MDILRTFENIWEHLGTFGDIWGYLGTFGDIWGVAVYAVKNICRIPLMGRCTVYSAVGSCYWLSTAATRRAPSGASGLV